MPHKVLRLRILKPADEGTWKDLSSILKEVRYRVFRLANLAVSQAYLNFHLWRTGHAAEVSKVKIGQLNRDLRKMLLEEGEDKYPKDHFSEVGALPSSVVDALSQYKVKALTTKSKWQDVLRGKSSLPTFRLGMAVPIRCDQPQNRRLEK